MVNLLIAAVFLLMCQHEVCTDLRFDYFKRIMVEERVNISWSVGNVSSKLKCTTLCLAEGKCVTFGFNEAMGSCQAVSPGERKAKGKHGFTAYYSRSQTGGMFEPCVDANQCHINGSECYNGKCMCTPGLSYHKKEKACVRKCSRYGKTMSIYAELGISGHNTKHLTGITQIGKCIDMCAATTDFECLSVELKKKSDNCHLSSYGYLDVNESDRETGQNGWLLGTRDCACD